MNMFAGTNHSPQENWVLATVDNISAVIRSGVLNVDIEARGSSTAPYRVVHAGDTSFRVEIDLNAPSTPDLMGYTGTFAFPDLSPAPREIWIQHGGGRLICREIPEE
jgi:hypothetical protein